jgi:hypothetical protein
MQQSQPATALAIGSFAADNAAAIVPLQRPSAAVEACLRAIERVEQLMDQETFALRQHQVSGLADFNHRKSHGLLELTRAIRSLGNAAAGHGLQPRLLSLQAKLRENADALSLHLRAVQEVSALVTRAIRDGESDGTYSAAIRFSGEKT